MELEEARKEAFRVYQEHLRTEVIVARILHDCRQLLTEVEYSLVRDKSEDDNESAMDELIKVLLTKEANDFDWFCLALRKNGYSDWATQLEAKAREGEVASISPADPQLLTDVETVWIKEEPPKTNSPTNGTPNQVAKHEETAQEKESANISPNDRPLPLNMEWMDSTLATGPPIREEDQMWHQGLSTSGEVSQPPSQSPHPKKKRVSLATSASQVLEKHEEEFFDVVDAKLDLLRLKRKKVITESLISKIETANSKDAKEILFQHLQCNADVAALREYCTMIIAADAFPKLQKLGAKMLTELTSEGAGQPSWQTDSQSGAQAWIMTPTSSDRHEIMHTYTTGLIICDMDIIRSKKDPEKAIKSLYFNAYSMLIRILRTCYSSIKSSAVDAALMQQVDATEEEVKQAQDLSALFRCLKINRNWNEFHFLDVAITSLPPEESEKREAALLVLRQYKSYLRAYEKATSIKSGKSEFGLFPRKRGREERWVVTKVTVDKDIDEYTYGDCLELWKLFLIKALEIPEDCIQFCDAIPGNSTTLIFMILQTFGEGTKDKLSKPAAVWVMKELGILRVYAEGVFNMDLREVLPNVLNASIRDGLKSGVDFMSITKDWSSLMYSLVDRVPEPKDTQMDWVQPHSAGPAELSVSEPVVESATSTSLLKDLLLASEEGRLYDVQFLLDRGRCKVNDEDEEGFTAILKAASKGRLTVLQKLVEQYGGNVMHRNKQGLNAFLMCAEGGHLAVAEYLGPKTEGHLFDSDDDRYTALHWAASSGQLSMVEYLMRSCGFDVKAIDKWGTTPLLRAAQNGHAEVVHFLLENGSNVQEENNDGWTAVLLAARYGHKEVVQELCETFEADFLHKKKGGSNAFLLCAEGGHLAVAEYLAPKMEDHLFESDDDGNTALHLAAYFGHLPVAKYLMRSCGFDVKAIDKWGNTPLLRAAQGSHAEVVHFLLENGSNVQEENNDGSTAVLLAAGYGHKEVVQELCETFEADFLHRMKGGRNAFLLCAEGSHLAVAEYLAPKMAGHLFDTNDNGSTALHWAAQEGQLSMVKYLVKSCGFDVKAIDKWGKIPLLRAAQGGHAEVAHFLLENGSDVEEQDNDGWTSVLLAARYGHKEIVQELCETFEADFLHKKKRGLNAFLLCATGGHLPVAEYLAPKMGSHLFDSDDDGNTALHLAAYFGHLSVVKYLVRSCGFNVKAIDKWGYTPLLRAARKGHAEVARFLLENGSNVQEENNDGSTAVLLAASYGHKEVVQELCETFEADFLHKKKRGESALQIAVRKGHLDVVKILIQVYRDFDMENEVDQYYMELANDHHHEHLVEYLSSEFPTLKRKVRVPQPRPTMYPQVWSISGPGDPDY